MPHCIMGSREQWELPPFFRHQWQSLCTALTAGNCLPLGLCKGTVKKSAKFVITENHQGKAFSIIFMFYVPINHRWLSDAGISRLGHPKMADAFPGKQLWGRISPRINNRHSSYLDHMTLEKIVTIGFDQDEAFFANDRVTNCGGMPVSCVPDAGSSNYQLSNDARICASISKTWRNLITLI